MAMPMVEAQVTGASPQLPKFSLVNVHVTLYCTPDGNIGLFGKPTPPFPDALVMLQCGDGQLIANATTNGFGISYLHSDPMPVFPFFQPQNECKLIVNTTLSTCNDTLPSTGGLESTLTLIGTALLGDFIISSFKPTELSKELCWTDARSPSQIPSNRIFGAHPMP
ncbi:hypothetical protein DH2020_004556 [Rehmannia glutinosa]|uniref:Uncharacterized protein n=1 Tax=Rehmannia glutinosa TaxID=99300 RepID=A0ABR0XPR2_REHGL